MIGYAKCKDKEKLKNFIINNKKESEYGTIEQRGGWFYNNYDLLDEFFHQPKNKDVKNLFDYMNSLESHINKLISMIETLDDENQPLSLFSKNEIAGIIGYENDRYILPLFLFDITYLKDYNSMSLSELSLITDKNAVVESLPANISEISRNDLDDEMDNLKKIEEDYKSNLDDIKNAKTDELADLQKKIEEMKNELEEKKRNLMAVLQDKMNELNTKKKELEDKIFVLDSQIYSIRCYTGEIIKFHQITSGKTAEINEPMVIYQKIRFINEELGKYLSIFGFINDENSSTLLDVLRYRTDIRDLFVPNDKCVSILKSSRTGTTLDSHDLFENILKSYEVYHGKQIAILIRNGENLYIGWTDTERVDINDDNLFYMPKKDTYSDIDDIEKTVSSSKYEKVSRLFILNILQGIMDFNKNIINLPDKINLLKPSDYVVFSIADGWLKDDKYGTFADIIYKSKDIKLKVGDSVLTGMRIGRDDGYSFKEKYEAYNNNRGIGSYNRTHDASIKGMTIYPINIVYYDVTVKYTYEKYACERAEGNKAAKNTVYLRKTEKLIGTCDEKKKFSFETWRDYIKCYGYKGAIPIQKLIELEEQNKEKEYITDNNEHNCCYIHYFHEKDEEGLYSLINKDDICEYYWLKPVKAEIIDKSPNYFVSVEGNPYSWYGNSYSVNMQFYNNEVIPLTYLCSTWIKYCIITANIGDFSLCNNQMTYSDMLPYLKIMLDYLNERSNDEKALLEDAGLSDWIEKNQDWDVLVTEWRIENKVRQLTRTSAKRFAKSIMDK